MYPWTKRPMMKVKDKVFSFNLCYRSRAQAIFFSMILLMMLLILYHIAASDSDTPKVTRDNLRLVSLEKMKKHTMENINEVMSMTQPPAHLAWQKEYEGRLMSGVKNPNSDSNDEIKDRILLKDINRPSAALFDGHKIVHLDLKGAPPKLSYYEEIFPLISNLGGTGLLIEYEDMFPFRYSELAARNAYSKEDITKIISLATQNNLEVIPLVQTFGHLEFLLKLRKYKHLREVAHYPQVVCPTNNQTLPLIKDMIDDVIELHPKSMFIHIGSDEVYYLGECGRCLDTMVKQSWSKSGLFLHHVSTVARYIKHKYTSLTVLMWDDEFRQLTLEELLDSQINKLVQPVIWKYTPEIESALPVTLWEKYEKVFPVVWLASAFKGATGPDKYTTDIYHHLENHRSWMRVVKAYSNKILFRGIFLTGWQRYDHFAILCELLPVGFPSLAVNLGYLASSDIDAQGPSDKAISELKCDSGAGLMRNSIATHCSFPGSVVYEGALRLMNLNEDIQRMMDDSTFRGWFTEYNIQLMFSSKSHVEHATAELDRFKMELLYIEKDIVAAMTDIYDSATMTEWVATFIAPLNTKLTKLWEAKERLLSKDDWPRRPLTSFDRQ